jgi:hypothetical protein
MYPNRILAASVGRIGISRNATHQIRMTKGWFEDEAVTLSRLICVKKLRAGVYWHTISFLSKRVSLQSITQRES